MPNNYLLKKKEIRVRPPHSDFVNLQRPRQCAPTKEASSHQGCAADVAQTRQQPEANSVCRVSSRMQTQFAQPAQKSECDHRTRISSIRNSLGNAHQRRRQAATKAAPPTSPKRGSNWMQTQFAKAIWTALVAAPLRSWSPQHQRVRPHGSVRSSRMRPTKTLS